MKNNYIAFAGLWVRERTNFELDTRDGITEDAKYVFENGQCHSLAVAIHDLTGWDLLKVDGGRHVMCKIDDNTFVDIHGVHDSMGCDCYALYGDDECECVELLTRDEIMAGLPYYLPCEPDNAKPYAIMVLQTYFGDEYKTIN